MISIEAYRAAIGIYVFTARFLSQLEPRKRCNSPNNIDFALFQDSNVYFLSLILLFEIILSLYLSFLYAFVSVNSNFVSKSAYFKCVFEEKFMFYSH